MTDRDPRLPDRIPELPAGAAPPTVADPTAGGVLCGSHRSNRQLDLDRHTTEREPWPWCLRRSGWGTEHVGIGRCRYHGGASPQANRSARLRVMELQGPVTARLGQLIADPDTSARDIIRAFAEIMDRTGLPRRNEVDVAGGRETLRERLGQLEQEMAEGDYGPPDDEDDERDTDA